MNENPQDRQRRSGLKASVRLLLTLVVIGVGGLAMFFAVKWAASASFHKLFENLGH